MNGSMMTTISIAAVDKSRCTFARKKIGTPTAAAMEKTNKLPLGQVEHDLRFDTVKILRDRNKCH